MFAIKNMCFYTHTFFIMFGLVCFCLSTHIYVTLLLFYQVLDNLQVLTRKLAVEPLVARVRRRHIHTIPAFFEPKESRLLETRDGIRVVWLNVVTLNDSSLVVERVLNFLSDILVIRFDGAGVSTLAVLDNGEHGLPIDNLLNDTFCVRHGFVWFGWVG